MSKRFTDTEKWKDEWFLTLDNDWRIVWQYMLDNCSNAGLLKKNFKLLNFCCNMSITEENLLCVFKDRLIDIGKFYFIPKFLKFQYPHGLVSLKPAVIGIRKEVLDNKLVSIIKQSLGNDYPMNMDMEKDMEKDMDKVVILEEREKPFRFSPPTPLEVVNYAHGQGWRIDADRFVDFYKSKNWMVGKNKMKDWQAAVRNWIRNEKKIPESKTIKTETPTRENLNAGLGKQFNSQMPDELRKLVKGIGK